MLLAVSHVAQDLVTLLQLKQPSPHGAEQPNLYVAKLYTDLNPSEH